MNLPLIGFLPNTVVIRPVVLNPATGKEALLCLMPDFEIQGKRCSLCNRFVARHMASNPHKCGIDWVGPLVGRMRS